jgi:hypothetical protein
MNRTEGAVYCLTYDIFVWAHHLSHRDLVTRRLYQREFTVRSPCRVKIQAPTVALRHTQPPIQWSNVKFTPEQTTKAQRRNSGIAILFFDLDTGQRHDLGKRPGTQCIGGWVGPRAGLDGCEKSRPPPPGFDLWTVQPVASRYTDWAMPAPLFNGKSRYFLSGMAARTRNSPLSSTQ